MGNKTKKELEDEYFLQLEQDMKKQSDESDEFFGFNYLKEEKNVENNKSLKKIWYEILIIIIFLTLGALSIYFEWPFYTVICWIFFVYFFSGFSSKSDIPKKSHPTLLNPFNFISYKIWFYKTKRLYSILTILTIIFVFIYGPVCEGLEVFIFLLLTPIAGLIGLFLGRFVTEIIKFTQRAIKGEIDWKKVFRELLLVFIIGVIARICIKYDISPEKYPILKIFS